MYDPAYSKMAILNVCVIECVVSKDEKVSEYAHKISQPRTADQPNVPRTLTVTSHQEENLGQMLSSSFADPGGGGSGPP